MLKKKDNREVVLLLWLTTDVFRKAAESRLTTDLHKLLAVTQKRPAAGHLTQNASIRFPKAAFLDQTS
jgi:hypothetical protein